jgi:sarcosine oxidase subunit delta
MRIPCPYCGERGNEEFAYLGDADVLMARPEPPSGGDPADTTSQAAFHAYVYLRDNPAGAHNELWYHASGCHAWLVVRRDTRTHAIRGVELAQDVAGGGRG